MNTYLIVFYITILILHHNMTSQTNPLFNNDNAYSTKIIFNYKYTYRYNISSVGMNFFYMNLYKVVNYIYILYYYIDFNSICDLHIVAVVSQKHNYGNNKICTNCIGITSDRYHRMVTSWYRVRYKSS